METAEILSVVMIQSSLPVSFLESISVMLINVLGFFYGILSFTPRMTAEENHSETVSKVVQIVSNAI